MPRKGDDLIHIKRHGPFRMQLVEVGGFVDKEGMTTASFHLPMGEAANLAQAELFAWFEVELSHAKFVARRMTKKKRRVNKKTKRIR